jgi:hypothetical protein
MRRFDGERLFFALAGIMGLGLLATALAWFGSLVFLIYIPSIFERADFVLPDILGMLPATIGFGDLLIGAAVAMSIMLFFNAMRDKNV